MPQGAIATAVINNSKAALNQTAAGVVKTGKGILIGVVVVSPGTTSGALTLNDSATVAGAAAGNVLWSVPFNGTGFVAGASFRLEIPFTNGLVISAVPGAGTPAVNVVYI